MKIGILTFHWATNYGAVLQAYASQTYLGLKGHDVKIINYKPAIYDDTLWHYLRYRKFLNHTQYKAIQRKERAIAQFREHYIVSTERIRRCSEIENVCDDFDCIVSGSDQILNPSFLLHGEGFRRPSGAYFLDFPFKGKKVGYAVSFGCIEYPLEVSGLAKEKINNFDIISTREASGIKIIESLGRNDAIIVPDPTLLLSVSYYAKLANDSKFRYSKEYIYCFFISNIIDRKKSINAISLGHDILWNNEDGLFCLQDWLRKIQNAEFVITDSFHCVMMCLLFHKSFAVITELEGNVGMNDRMFTVLGEVGLEKHIIYKERINEILSVQYSNINWSIVDDYINRSQKVASDFYDRVLDK